MLCVFPCPIPIFDALVRYASLSIVLLGSVPVSLPLRANIESVSDTGVVALLLVALADRAFVVDAFGMDAFGMDAVVTDASDVVDIVAPWRSKTDLKIFYS